MKITNVEPVLLSHVYPDDVTLEWSAGTIESWDASLVRIETDTGLVGWGEAGHLLNGNEAIRGIVEAFRPYVEGRTPENVRAIREELYDTLAPSSTASFISLIKLITWSRPKTPPSSLIATLRDTSGAGAGDAAVVVPPDALAAPVVPPLELLLPPTALAAFASPVAATRPA